MRIFGMVLCVLGMIVIGVSMMVDAPPFGRRTRLRGLLVKLNESEGKLGFARRELDACKEKMRKDGVLIKELRSLVQTLRNENSKLRTISEGLGGTRRDDSTPVWGTPDHRVQDSQRYVSDMKKNRAETIGIPETSIPVDISQSDIQEMRYLTEAIEQHLEELRGCANRRNRLVDSVKYRSVDRATAQTVKDLERNIRYHRKSIGNLETRKSQIQKAFVNYVEHWDGTVEEMEDESTGSTRPPKTRRVTTFVRTDDRSSAAQLRVLGFEAAIMRSSLNGQVVVPGSLRLVSRTEGEFGTDTCVWSFRIE